METCKKCGLPKDLCTCETLSKVAQRIRISLDKKRFGKIVTTIHGIDEKDIDIKNLTSELKSELACGGTFKNGVIELQGNHKQKIKNLLIKHGFSKDSISD